MTGCTFAKQGGGGEAWGGTKKRKLGFRTPKKLKKKKKKTPKGGKWLAKSVTGKIKPRRIAQSREKGEDSGRS